MSPLARGTMNRILRLLSCLIGLSLWTCASLAQTSINVAAQTNGGVATASSTYDATHPPSGANNGDRKGLNWTSGGGWGDGTGGVFPDWLQITFSAARSITEIDVFTIQDNNGAPVDPTPTMTFSTQGITAFEVQYWNGSAWVDVPGGNVTGNNLVWRQFTFAAISTDRIRVLVNNALAGYSRIMEVEAWSAGTLASLTAPANNATLQAPATVNLSATTANTTGGIVKVEFYRDTTLVATATAPSSGTPSSGTYTATDTAVAPGTYSYTAKAYDSVATTTTTAAVVSVSQGAGSVNVAAQTNGGVATASSIYTTGFGPTGANNGDRKSGWGSGGGWADGTGSAYPDWLQINFRGVQSVAEIDVFTVQDNTGALLDPTPGMTFTLWGITAFEVQYWNGSAWVDVPGGNVTGNNLVWRRFLFAPISTDRIRVLVNNALAGSSRIMEVEAWSAGTFANLTAPANNAILPAPATVSLSAQAYDAAGAIGKVEFYRDTTLVATVTAPGSGNTTSGTYAATDTLSAPGNYSYTAKVYDAANPAIVNTSNASVVGVPPGAGSVNVAAQASGAVATASSIYTTGFGPTGAINGDRMNGWGGGGGWGDATPNAFPDWLQVNFNNVQSIGEIDVVTLQDGAPLNPTPTMTFSTQGITAFQVQSWNGSAWVDVPGGNVTGNNQVWRRFTFAPISTDRIRVLVNNALLGYSRIMEVEAWSAGTFVNLTAPANNLIVPAPATVNLSANASNATGTIGKVEFYRNGTLIATATTPSSGTASSGTYTATDTVPAPGNYSYTAKAYDAASPSVVSNSGTSVVAVLQDSHSTNVALQANGGVATASSVWASTQPASGAINGDRANGWGAGGGWSDATTNAFPDWLQINFNGVKSLAEIDVYTIQDNPGAPLSPTPGMTFTLYGITAFEVQYWNGSAWVDVPGGNVTGNNLVWRRFIFDPISTDRIRLLVNNALAGNSRVMEVEAWKAAPPAPGTLSAAVGATTQLNLAWAPPADSSVTGYKVERCQGAGCGNFAEIAAPATVSYNDTGRTPATSYSYRVRATDAAGYLGPYSNVASTSTPPDTTPPATPGGLTATVEATTKINLAWSAPTDDVGVTGYRIERCLGAGCSTFAEITASATTAYSDLGVLSSASYSYRVRGFDAAGNLGAYSNVASATTGASEQLGYIFPDHLNTPRLIADQAGNAVWRNDNTEPFGDSVPNNNPSGLGAFEFNLRFPGQYFDRETSLAYNYYRDYDPSIGRYVEADPIGLRGGINDYLYVRGNPPSFSDPRGLAVFGGISFGTTVFGPLAIGGGGTIVACRDECDKLHRFKYLKVCGGLSTGTYGSAFIGKVFNMDGKQCRPDSYSGYFVEFSAGLGVAGGGVDIGLTQDENHIPGGPSGVNEIGGGLSNTGGSAMLCYYFYMGEI